MSRDKGVKSDMICELQKELKEPLDMRPPFSPLISAAIFDFMLHSRAIASVCKSMTTFENFADEVMKRFIAISMGCVRMDIVFDVYSDDSIKAGER